MQADMIVALCLFGVIVALVIVLMHFFSRENSIRRDTIDNNNFTNKVINELSEIGHKLAHVTMQLDSCTHIDEVQQRELRQMLKITETRLLDAIQRVDARYNHPSLHINNSHSERRVGRDIGRDANFVDGDQEY